MFVPPICGGKIAANAAADVAVTNKMDLDQLRTFLEVAKLGNFSRAAEKVQRSQPAVSAQITPLPRLYPLPVRRAGALPTASSGFHLAMETLRFSQHFPLPGVQKTFTSK